MKKNLATLIALLFLSLIFPKFGSSQDNVTNELRYELERAYPYLSISKAQLNKARTLSDLDWRYKPSWVKEYISVEIVTSYKGKIKTAVSKDNKLSQEQKDMMSNADPGKDITVNIKYIPENTLKHNEPKEHDFIFTVNPENDAEYASGQQQLKQYLKEKAIDYIPYDNFDPNTLAAIKFTVNEDGEINDAHVFISANDKKTDELLLQAIRNMPCWKPAEYADGTKVKQEFILRVGNMESCLLNHLNIYRDSSLRK